MASVSVPTTTEVSDLIVAHIDSSLQESAPILPKAFTRVLAKALSGVFVLLYKYAAFIFLQMFARHASWRETEVNGRLIRPLVEIGRFVGVGDPVPAARCEAVVHVPVTNQTGTLEAGQQLVRSTTGVIYTVVSAVGLTDATVAACVRATVDGAGVVGDLAVNDVLSFVNPLPNVATDVTVVAINTPGTDGDTEATYRRKVVRRRQTQPQGGAYADYRSWGEELADIRAVYPYTGSTPGELDVYVEAEPTADNEDGIPTSDQLTRVSNSIASSSQSASGLANRQNVLHAVNTLAITRAQFTLQLSGFVVSDTTAAQAAVTAAVDEFLRDREPFILGLSALPKRDRFTRADLAGIVSAAVAAYGGSVTSVTLLESATPIEARILAAGELARLATNGITFA